MQVNGWELFVHPLLLAQLGKLIARVEEDRTKKPDSCRSSSSAKLLAALSKLLFEAIPADPSRPEYRQGDALGPQNRHSFRAKFGAQRFRLFFRYDSRSKIIVYAWVNDSETLRTYGSRSDAYAVFKNMLESGNPPRDWHELLTASKSAEGAAAKVFP